MPEPRKFLGCFTRKERWGLSPRGWLAVISIFLLAAILWLVNIQPFLAKTERADTKILVVEGWVHEFAIRAAVNEFKSGAYEKIYTTGGPVVGDGGYSNDFNTAASVGADLLKKDGIADESLQMVPSRVSGRDRTYSSAVALRDWFRAHNVSVHNMNVLTEDCHARRTRLLFQEAFGPGVTVGVISIPDPDYDAKHWWRYSEGVREVLGENIAWIYAKFFFHPSK
jgi:uncharacterized SAM-binding protein YcdF (DUF218 family)